MYEYVRTLYVTKTYMNNILKALPIYYTYEHNVGWTLTKWQKKDRRVVNVVTLRIELLLAG